MPSRYDKYRTHHTSRRLDGWDYTAPAAYFVTVCTHERACIFGFVTDGRMYLNAAGRIAAEEWRRTGQRRDEVHLDVFVVMPNHVHGIIVIAPPEEDAPTDVRGYDVRMVVAPQRATALPFRSNNTPTNVRPKSLGAAVRGFKSAVTRRINRRRGTPGGKVWQRNYYDVIIRDARHWRAVRRYIATNPARWGGDNLYLR